MNLTDPYGRIIDYLRVSITERCNLNCVYCRPVNIPALKSKNGGNGEGLCEEYRGRTDGGGRLTADELLSFCREAAFLGIRHIRVTGGEPLLRRDCPALIAALKRLPEIETVTLTTNGVLLSPLLRELKEAGIDGINVSLDTMDRTRYQSFTGADQLDAVLSGIDGAVSLGIPVKINCVILADDKTEDGGSSGGLNSGGSGRTARFADYFSLAGLARSLPIDVRFIEAMPIGGFSGVTLDYRELLEQFSIRYPGMERFTIPRGFGPAIYYRIPGFSGCIGFISALHGNFCRSCNRIRLTSRGVLKSCLAYEGTIHLKPLFTKPAPEAALRAALLAAVSEKPPFHRFSEAHPCAERADMSKIGG